jgi:hypothetical protein
MRPRIAPLTLALVALLVAAPLWGPGMVNTRGGGDSPFLLQRLHQLLANLRAGGFPVRWMPDAAYGLGYPFFNYYSALPYYLAAGFSLVGLNLLAALKLTQTVGFIAAALAMYGWARQFTDRDGAAWLAGVAYTGAPFHLVNVYVRGDSLSEFYAFVFYPLILWGLDRACRRRPEGRGMARLLPWLWPAVAYGGLILTHNISALIFSPFVLLYLLVLAWRAEGRRGRILVAGGLALGWGVVLSAWVAVPTLLERDAVQTTTLTAGYFHYARHFRTLDLVQPRPLFNYRVTEGGTSPFAMGLAQAAFALLGGAVLALRALRGRLNGRWAFVLAGLVIATLMITPLSAPLWEHLPLLSMIQFPWRFLSVQALFAAAATAALLPRGRPGTWIAGGVALLLTLAVVLPLRPERLPIGPDDVTVERLQLYELFTQNVGTTIRYEWLPRAVEPRPFTSDAVIAPGAPPPAIPLDGASLEAALVERGPTAQTWRVDGAGGALAFPLLYWPGWRAAVDGVPVEPYPVAGSGYLALTLPPGEHVVALHLTRTWPRVLGEALSLAGWLGVALVLVRARRAVRWRVGLRALVWLLVPALPLLLLPQGRFGGVDDLTMDFDRLPYLHHNPGGVAFEGGARLDGYALSAEVLRPGETLAVSLDWARWAGGRAELALVTPAAPRQPLPPLVTGTCAAPDCTVALPLPEDLARGVYLLRLTLSDEQGERRALTPGGETRGTLYLRPVRVPEGDSVPSEAPLLARFGSNLRLHAARLTQPDPDRLLVELTWSAAQPVGVNYMLSLRLLDAEGRLAFMPPDTQPGYGFQPTSLWHPGQRMTSRYWLAPEGDLPAGGPYQLELVLYRADTLEPLGQARLGTFTLPLETPFAARPTPRRFDLPSLDRPLDVVFGERIELAGYRLESSPADVQLTLWWHARSAPTEDYTVFVHLFDPTTEDVVAQWDAMPRAGAYPTSWWAAGEVISETVTLPLNGVPAGDYRVAVGLYDRNVTRLPVVDGAGDALDHRRVVLPIPVEVQP